MYIISISAIIQCILYSMMEYIYTNFVQRFVILLRQSAKQMILVHLQIFKTVSIMTTSLHQASAFFDSTC